MKRTRLRPRPRQRDTDLQMAHAWFLAVTRRARCVMCGARRPLQAHHVVPQEVLRKEFPRGAVLCEGLHRRWRPVGRLLHLEDIGLPVRSLQEILYDPRNGIPLCPVDHERHTSAATRVRYDRLPRAAIDFAHEYGLGFRVGPRFYEQ